MIGRDIPVGTYLTIEAARDRWHGLDRVEFQRIGRDTIQDAAGIWTEVFRARGEPFGVVLTEGPTPPIPLIAATRPQQAAPELRVGAFLTHEEARKRWPKADLAVLTQFEDRDGRWMKVTPMGTPSLPLGWLMVALPDPQPQATEAKAAPAGLKRITAAAGPRRWPLLLSGGVNPPPEGIIDAEGLWVRARDADTKVATWALIGPVEKPEA